VIVQSLRDLVVSLYCESVLHTQDLLVQVFTVSRGEGLILGHLFTVHFTKEVQL